MRAALFLSLMMVLLPFSLATNTLNQNYEPILEDETVASNVILPLGNLSVPGFQEGSVFTDTTMSSGGAHTCVILNNGSLSCWGYGYYGQLGNGESGSYASKTTPTLTSSLGANRTAVAVSSGGSHTCVILDNGSVSCWGYGANGRLGNGGTSDKNTPTLTTSFGSGRTAVALSSGIAHTCVILDNGSVSCWGQNNYGQLGNGETTDKSTPSPTSSLGVGRTAIAIASGQHHTCAILDNGAVSCWGQGESGKLGNGGASHRNTPTLTSSLGTDRTAVAISAGVNHMCALLDNGSVSCWGHNMYGELGDGGTSRRDTPTLTSSLGVGRNAVAISSGNFHTCAILDNGSVSCWGYGANGQLGNGATSSRTMPTATSSFGTDRTAVAISSGDLYTCVILDNSSASCWGRGDLGRLGNTITSDQTLPTLVSSLGFGRTVALSERDLDGDGIINIFDSDPYILIWDVDDTGVDVTAGDFDFSLGPSGGLSLLYYDYHGGQYLYYGYRDETSWSHTQLTGQGGVFGGPPPEVHDLAITVDSSDVVHIAYSTFNGGSGVLYYLTNSANTWAQEVVAYTNSQLEVTVEVNSTNIPYILTSDRDEVLLFSPGTSTWSETTVDDGTDSSTTNQNGEIGEHTKLLFWQDDFHVLHFAKDIGIKHHSLRASNPNSWSTAVVPNTNSTVGFDAAVDSDVVQLVAHRMNSSHSILEYTNNYNAVWGNGMHLVDEKLGLVYGINVLVDSSESVNVVYSHENQTGSGGTDLLKVADIDMEVGPPTANAQKETLLQNRSNGTNVVAKIASDDSIHIVREEYISPSPDEYDLVYTFRTNMTIVNEFDQTSYFDGDGDGVFDQYDDCPDTDFGVIVDEHGCDLDTDGDGVRDSDDQCPETDSEVIVDHLGCDLDSDNDGVRDSDDQCPQTASGVVVDNRGCDLDSDGDGVRDSDDQCPNTPAVPVDSRGCEIEAEVDSDNDGVNDDVDNCPNTPAGTSVDGQGCEVVSADCGLSYSPSSGWVRGCQIPQSDIDWDGVPDTDDDDQDGDGRLDLSEFTDTIQNNDPATADQSVMSSPYSGTVHNFEITSENGELTFTVDYAMTYVEFVAHLPLVAYYNEDGTEKPVDEYVYTLKSESDLNRLENQMCQSPNLGDLFYSFPRFPLWLENITVDSAAISQNFECSWEERRDVNLMTVQMIFDDMQLANWKETVRYSLTIEDQGQFSSQVTVELPAHDGVQGKVWSVNVGHGSQISTEIAHPWVENILISLPAPPATTTEQETQQPTISPGYTSGWSFIADVSTGQIDCSGYSSSTSDDLSNFYQQNDLEYIGLNGYHEYRISDDTVSISCSGALEFEEAMDGDEIDFCVYLFLDGVRKDSDCASGTFVLASLSGQRQTLDEVIDDFNQDLDDLEQQWQDDLDDLFSTPESSASSSSDDVSFDDFFILLIVAALIGGIVQSIQKKNKEKATARKKHSSKRSKKKAFDSQPSSYVEPEVLQPNQEIVEEESYDTTEFHDSAYDSEYLETETASEDINAVGEVSYNQPPFSFSGEIDEHGWEVCEYPRSSGIWWWKDYEAEQWVLWE